MKSLSISSALILALVVVRPSPAEEPATIEKASTVLDLAKFPLPTGVEPPRLRRLAGLSYETSSSVAEAFAHVRKTLAEAGWSEAPDGYSGDQAASGVFTKGGFRVSVSAFAGSKAGSSSVTILNHGDVEAKSLPVPEGSKLLYETPLGPAYLAPGTVDAVAGEVDRRLREQGWEPYGSAGDVRSYKRNAVKLGARVTSAPAQGGKTMLAYATELMSADLPAPEDAVRPQYADATKELSFDVRREPEAVFGAYREALARKGWEPVTKSPTKERLGESLRFRNPAGELLTLELQTIDGLSRGRLRHESAEEVKAMLVSASKPKPAAAPPAAKPVVRVAIPAGVRDLKVEGGRIAFKAAAGKGLASAKEVLEALRSDGWKEQAAAFEGPAGAASLQKDEASLTISYTDVGLGDAEVTLDAIGATLARKP